MSYFSIGDMAQTYLLQRRGVAIKQDMNRLTEELASGRTQDVTGRLGGDFSPLAEIERTMTVLDGYRLAGAEAAQFSASMQTVLERVQDISADLGNGILTTTTGNVTSLNQSMTTDARNQLGALIGSLNTDHAGRNLFSGNATDQAPLVDAETLLTALSAAIVPITDAATMMADAQAWFASPTGFDALVYQGSTTGISPFELGPNESVSLDIRANDPALKNVLMHTALTALSGDPALAVPNNEQVNLLRLTGEGLMAAQDGITVLRSGVGFAEERIDNYVTRNASERTSIEYAKGALLGVDQFETATRLEEVQFQLESLYSVTVRLSRLNLVSFLR